MSSDQFCLRWNNHHPNLISAFSTLLQNDLMVDVTLIADDREIHAHKIILSACSPFFQNIFLRNSCKHPVIVLTEIKFEHLKSLIDFIYIGKVNIFEAHLPELLRIANILKIKGLVSEDTIIENSSENDDSSETEPNESTESFSPNVTEIIKTELTELTEPTETDETEQTATLSNDASKSTKKRKSVSFSDIPEIVYGELGPGYFSTGNEQNDKKKRKLRSSTEMCTITKIDPLQIYDKSDHPQSGATSQFIGTCSTSIQTTQPMNSDHKSAENQLAKPGPNPTSRKMIRKNENFLRALEAVRTQGIGFCKAAKIHGVNNRTLWLEYQKLGYPMKNARKKSN